MTYNTWVGFVLLFVFSFGVNGLNTSELCQRNTASAGDEYWINPGFVCMLKPGERPIRQYPFGKGKSYGSRVDTVGFYDFCSRMVQHFASSGISVTEANLVYDVIFTAGLIRDASYGMPGSNARPPGQLTIEELKLRVSIRKRDAGVYELFYTRTGCGTHYRHEWITINGMDLKDRRQIESWKGSYPC
jgi:hypothetical protein